MILSGYRKLRMIRCRIYRSRIRYRALSTRFEESAGPVVVFGRVFRLIDPWVFEIGAGYQR